LAFDNTFKIGLEGGKMSEKVFISDREFVEDQYDEITD